MAVAGHAHMKQTHCRVQSMKGSCIHHCLQPVTLNMVKGDSLPSMELVPVSRREIRFTGRLSPSSGVQVSKQGDELPWLLLVIQPGDTSTP